MPTPHDTTSTQLNALASAIASYPAQSVDTQAALAWVSARLAAIAADAEPAPCPTCSVLLERRLAVAAPLMLN